jgi:hypothetical protein
LEGNAANITHHRESAAVRDRRQIGEETVMNFSQGPEIPEETEAHEAHVDLTNPGEDSEEQAFEDPDETSQNEAKLDEED